MTIDSSMTQFVNSHKGEILSAREIVRGVAEISGCLLGSIIPSDYATNPSPDRTAPMKEPRLLKRVKRGSYLCLGV